MISLFKDYHFWILISFLVAMGGVARTLFKNIKERLSVYGNSIEEKVIFAENTLEMTESILMEERRRLQKVDEEIKLMISRVEGEGMRQKEMAYKRFESQKKWKKRVIEERMSHIQFSFQPHIYNLLLKRVRYGLSILSKDLLSEDEKRAIILDRVENLVLKK